jgi:hypothetical protein
MTRDPKKKLRLLSNKLSKEVGWMHSRLKYVEGPTGWNGTGPLAQIPYVPLASVERQKNLIKSIRKTVKEIRKSLENKPNVEKV